MPIRVAQNWGAKYFDAFVPAAMRGQIGDEVTKSRLLLINQNAMPLPKLHKFYFTKNRQENNMKQIKAVVHPNRVSAVVEALRDSGLFDSSAGSGCYNLTVSTVQRLFTSTDPAQQHYSVALAEPVVDEVKLELVCDDQLVEQLNQIIVRAARSGAGWIFVSDIHSATRIA